MPTYEITHVKHDENEVITHVKINNAWIHAVEEVVNWINNNVHNFFTSKNGRRADVYAKKHHISGRWFLTTDPDDTKENNLDFLPKC